MSSFQVPGSLLDKNKIQRIKQQHPPKKRSSMHANREINRTGEDNRGV